MLSILTKAAYLSTQQVIPAITTRPTSTYRSKREAGSMPAVRRQDPGQDASCQRIEYRIRIYINLSVLAYPDRFT